MALQRRTFDLRLSGAVRGSTVMVTGASSGIGAEASRALAQAGAHVLLVARSEDRLRTVRDEIVAAGGSAQVLPTDLSDADSTEDLVHEVLASHGGIDVLVSNAGRSIRRSVELSHERAHDYQRTIDVNYLGPARLVLGFLPSMRSRRRGHIVSVSTLGVLFPSPRFSAYVASKSAFDAFLRCMAPEVRDDGVSVTRIYLPLVRTPMIEGTKVYGALPSLSAAEAARRICGAVAYRPGSIAPRSARVGTAVFDLFPGLFEWLEHRNYRASRNWSDAAGQEDAMVEVPLLESTVAWLRRLVEGRGQRPPAS